MKRQTFVNLIVLFLIIGVFVFLGIRQTFLGGGTSIDCTDGGTNKWVCSQIGQPEDFDDLNSINLYNPSDTTTRQSLLIEKLKYFDTNIDDFLNTHTQSSVSGGVRLYTPKTDCDSWVDKFPSGTYSCGNDNGIQLDITQLIVKELGNQTIILEGTTDDGRNFKTYGFGNVETTKSFKLVDPFPNEQDVKLTPSSVTIYFKQGGYTEQDLCSSFNIGCVNPNACTTDSDCVTNIVKTEYCSDDNNLMERTEENKCVDSECKLFVTLNENIENCSLGCGGDGSGGFTCLESIEESCSDKGGITCGNTEECDNDVVVASDTSKCCLGFCNLIQVVDEGCSVASDCEDFAHINVNGYWECQSEVCIWVKNTTISDDGGNVEEPTDVLPFVIGLVVVGVVVVLVGLVVWGLIKRRKKRKKK